MLDTNRERSDWKKSKFSVWGIKSIGTQPTPPPVSASDVHVIHKNKTNPQKMLRHSYAIKIRGMYTHFLLTISSVNDTYLFIYQLLW